MRTLAVHLPVNEFTTMLDRLRDRLCAGKEVIEMGKDRDEKNDDKPGRHEDDREGKVHEDTAKKIDPSKYGTDRDDDD